MNLLLLFFELIEPEIDKISLKQPPLLNDCLIQLFLHFLNNESRFEVLCILLNPLNDTRGFITVPLIIYQRIHRCQPLLLEYPSPLRITASEN